MPSRTQKQSRQDRTLKPQGELTLSNTPALNIEPNPQVQLTAPKPGPELRLYFHGSVHPLPHTSSTPTGIGYVLTDHTGKALYEYGGHLTATGDKSALTALYTALAFGLNAAREFDAY